MYINGAPQLAGISLRDIGRVASNIAQTSTNAAVRTAGAVGSRLVAGQNIRGAITGAATAGEIDPSVAGAIAANAQRVAVAARGAGATSAAVRAGENAGAAAGLLGGNTMLLLAAAAALFILSKRRR